MEVNSPESKEWSDLMRRNSELNNAAFQARAAISGMMRHSCVADSAPEDKDGEDHVAESDALRVIRLLDAVIDAKQVAD